MLGFSLHTFFMWANMEMFFILQLKCWELMSQDKIRISKMIGKVNF